MMLFTADTFYTNASTSQFTTLTTVTASIGACTSFTDISASSRSTSSTNIASSGRLVAYTSSEVDKYQPVLVSFSRAPQCSASSETWFHTTVTTLVTKVEQFTALTTGTNQFSAPWWIGSFQTPVPTTGVFQVTKTITETFTKGLDCCGACRIQYGEVSVRYWPAASSNTECLGNSTYYGTGFFKTSPATEVREIITASYSALRPRDYSGLSASGNDMTHRSSEQIYHVGSDGFT